MGDDERRGGPDGDGQVTQLAPAADTPLSDPTAKLLGDGVTAVTSSPARYELCAGCLGTRWHPQLGVPSSGTGPAVDVSHGPNEEAALHRVAAVYAVVANELMR